MRDWAYSEVLYWIVIAAVLAGTVLLSIVFAKQAPEPADPPSPPSDAPAPPTDRTDSTP